MIFEPAPVRFHLFNNCTVSYLQQCRHYDYSNRFVCCKITTMTTDEILQLQRLGTTRTVAAHKIIHITDASFKYVYILQKGLIKISNLSDNGTEIIKYIVKPGNIFGELNLLDNDTNRLEIAIAMEDAEICRVPVEEVRFIMENDKAFQRSINQSISDRINKMEQRMFALMLKDVKQRIMDFLKEFVAEFGYPVAGGYQARNFLTHEDIAKITTTTRQTVTSSLSHFKKLGWIDYNTRHLSVYNI